MDLFKTEQEKFWAGEFGDEYTDRNQTESLFASNLALFSEILKRTKSVKSVVEFGANVGVNLLAIKQVLPNVNCSAVEINQHAVKKLKQIKDVTVYDNSILDFETEQKYDFVLSKGVLIHINPKELIKVYDSMYKASKKYICIIEYYNPIPVGISYRGHSDKLFKRDFAGEFLDRFKDVILVDYGFVYHRDNYFPQDDVNWFLLEKL